MNYIKQLQAENQNQNAAIRVYENGLDDIRSYLLSPKFSGENGYVNVQDILLRIREIKNAALDARENTASIA